ncbi:hypothetical protein Csa_022794 [Cucumis sativus]|uniref:Leucine-rich repeat-containing N-terminal plant-type domain-containing protein n=1 Tax=Cucumis sativus TaxID=3659 RepID=A0A0A0LST6_CUCSA|nr:hypothetical protein Csa_022794 [Cucumis sativus]
MVDDKLGLCISLILLCLSTVCFCTSDINDVKILNDFREGLENPELLKWPDNGDDPCGIPPWPHVYCAGDRGPCLRILTSSLSSPIWVFEYNPFNAAVDELAKSVQLTNLSLVQSNLAGPLPEFLGTLSSLTTLKLSYNRLTGQIPKSFGQFFMQILWLNDQDIGMTGPIDVISSMSSLTQLWLHGNQFLGVIPQNIGDLSIFV